MPHYISLDRECACHRPLNGPSPFAFLAFRVGTDTLGILLNAHSDPHDGWEVDRGVPMAMLTEGEQRYTPAVRRWINDTITKQVRAHHEIGRFPIIIASQGGERRFFTYTVMPRLAGDTLIYGAEYEPDGFESMLRTTMTDNDILPSAFTRGRAVDKLVELEVTDANGRALFRTD